MSDLREAARALLLSKDLDQLLLDISNGIAAPGHRLMANELLRKISPLCSAALAAEEGRVSVPREPNEQYARDRAEDYLVTEGMCARKDVGRDGFKAIIDGYVAGFCHGFEIAAAEQKR